MSKDIDNILKRMRTQGKLRNVKEKGDAGEDAVRALISSIYSKHGGLMYHSYKYPYQSNRDGNVYLGNIKYENGKYVDYTKANYPDEIDILYVHPYRIIPIEVKSYHANLVLTDKWVYYNDELVDKSPITQAEKHARHLYHALYDVLPDGDASYIKPVVCFVDRCQVDDRRSIHMQEYVRCSILNNLRKVVMSECAPQKYDLDIEAIDNRLKDLREVDA